MIERLTPDAIQRQSLFLQTQLADNRTVSLIQTRPVRRLATAELHTGLALSAYPKIPFVLKVPSATLDPFFYNLAFGSPDGVRLALTTMLEEIAKPQLVSPEVAVVQIETTTQLAGKQQNTLTIRTAQPDTQYPVTHADNCASTMAASDTKRWIARACVDTTSGVFITSGRGTSITLAKTSVTRTCQA